MSDIDNDIYCAGCGIRLQQWEPEGEGQGDEMFIIPEPGGEKIYCQTCFSKR